MGDVATAHRSAALCAETGQLVGAIRLMAWQACNTDSPLLGWGLFFNNERSQFEITKRGHNLIYVSSVFLIE